MKPNNNTLKCLHFVPSPAYTFNYFRAMFKFDPKDTCQRNVVLHEVPGDVLEDLVSFFYTGYINLTETNVQGLVTTADMLQV